MIEICHVVLYVFVYSCFAKFVLPIFLSLTCNCVMTVEFSGGNGEDKMTGYDPKGSFYPWIVVCSIWSISKQFGEFANFPQVFFLTSHFLLFDCSYKDQAALDNSIPLSPQWLYSKPGESKMVSVFSRLNITCRYIYGHEINEIHSA